MHSTRDFPFLSTLSSALHRVVESVHALARIKALRLQTEEAITRRGP